MEKSPLVLYQGLKGLQRVSNSSIMVNLISHPQKLRTIKDGVNTLPVLPLLQG